MIKAGIIGASGYVGEELIRLLLTHPNVSIEAISSHSFTNSTLQSIYKNLIAQKTMIFDDMSTVIDKSDVIFLALPHGLSEEIASECVNKNKFVIDMGADFRIKDESTFKRWYGNDFAVKEIHEDSIYGLPEINKDKIKSAKIIANPGCYATSIELGLLPSIKNDLINLKTIICDSKSGVSGAGKSLSETTHYTNCNESLSAYKIGAHRHIGEIEEVLSLEVPKNHDDVEICFTPHLLPINRGILSTIYVDVTSNDNLESIHKLYKEFYKDCPFVNVLDLGESACIKDVKYSNYCNISLHTDFRHKKIIIVSCIDNMMKGAAGQAIQNMNIFYGLDETTGLNIIPPPF